MRAGALLAALAAPLLAALLGPAPGVAAEESSLNWTATADDSCPGDEDCSLSLLQVRARREFAESGGVAVEEGLVEEAQSPEGAGVKLLEQLARHQVSRRRRGGHHPAASGAAADAGGPKPTPTELKTMAAVVNRLWTIDQPYRLNPGRGYKLNHQAKAASLSSKRDTSPKPLFQFVDEAALQKEPCTKSFIALLDNFQRETDKAERVTRQSQGEVQTFIGELMKTPHMRYIYNVLVAWKTIKPGYASFAQNVSKIWFTEYSLKRRGPKVSSGFEHVFVGEEKLDRRTHRPTIIGLHNWIQFWREEKADRIDYLGYVGTLNKDDERLVSVRFAWEDDDPQVETKSVSTMLVGSSVPFEFAMLTCAFLGFGGEAKVRGIYFGDVGPAQITAYSWKAPEGQVIRTAFLEG